MTTRPIITALLVAAVLLGLSACQGADFPPGPSGKVTDRSRAYVKANGWRYWLTVTTPDGRQTKFRVRRDDHARCFRGSAYPTCTHR